MHDKSRLDRWIANCCNEKKKRQRRVCVDAVALTVKRRFSVRGDGGGIFMAMLTELVLFRECSECASSCGSLARSTCPSLEAWRPSLKFPWRKSPLGELTVPWIILLYELRGR